MSSTKAILENLLTLLSGVKRENTERFGLEVNAAQFERFDELLLRELKKYRDEIEAEREALTRHNAKLLGHLADTNRMIHEAEGRKKTS